MPTADIALIRDHLHSVDPAIPEWVVSLAALICESSGDDALIAVSRARDLYMNPSTSKSLQMYLEGWEGLRQVDLSKLTTFQRDTICRAVHFVSEDLGKIIRAQ